MQLQNVLIIHKKSLYEKLKSEGNLSIIKKLVLERKKYSKKIYLSHEEHEKTFRSIRKTLKKLRIKNSSISRGSVKSVSGFDLVITVGGDGTFLYGSHFVYAKPILGVNSSPSCSRGVFCGSNIFDFEEKIHSIKDDTLNYLKLYRLALIQNGNRVKIPVLNDILFSNEEPAGTSRYIISIDGLPEEHYSSGVWISTAAGSTGAIRSAGGRIMPLQSKDFQFRVREILKRDHEKYNNLGKILAENDKINFLSKMKKGLLSIDGHNIKIRITLGDRVEIIGGQNPLMVFGIDKKGVNTNFRIPHL